MCKEKNGRYGDELACDRERQPCSALTEIGKVYTDKQKTQFTTEVKITHVDIYKKHSQMHPMTGPLRCVGI